MALRAEHGGVRADGRPMATWDDLPVEQRNAWILTASMGEWHREPDAVSSQELIDALPEGEPPVLHYRGVT